MKLQKIGELKLLQEVRKRFSSRDSSIILGIGDDAAVLAPQKENLLVTTDMMNEGIHFDLSFTSTFHLGFKLVSVNVSDIMAMGGRPKYLFLNIALKKDADEEIFWKMYDGISNAMNIYGLSLAGGDLCAAENDMALSATIIGTTDRFITRAGAKAGDKIYVTGALGDSACGLEILKRLTPESKNRVRSSELGVKSKDKKESEEKDLFLTLNSKLLTLNWGIAEPLIKRHLMPVTRDSSEISKYATSMIDISDGLFIDLCRICNESNVGAKVYLDKIPVSDEMKHAAEIIGLDPMHLAVSGGEDYELLFTASEKLGVGSSELGINITCIGEIIEKDRIAVDKTGKKFPMKAEGYQHFGSSR